MKPNDERPTLDDVDLVLLRELQRDARTPNNRLAELAGIAPSTCLGRIRALRERGILIGYGARLEPRALGWQIQALVSVNIRAGARRQLTEFADQMRARPEVLQLFFLGGSEDFIVHLVARDSDAVRDFVVEHLSSNPAVASTRTSLVFEHDAQDVPLRVPQWR